MKTVSKQDLNQTSQASLPFFSPKPSQSLAAKSHPVPPQAAAKSLGHRMRGVSRHNQLARIASPAAPLTYAAKERGA